MTTTPESKTGPMRSGGVQSIERAFALLEMLADNDGIMGLSALADQSGLPPPTIHRLVRTLVDLGYVRQEPNREYALGPRLIRLGEASSRIIAIWARPHLARLADELGESANLAMLDGDQIVYVAQVQSRRAMRMFTEVGRRVHAHCTAVGKAILANMDPDDVQELLQRTGLPQQTPSTITDPDEFAKALQQISKRGYALDEGEQEVGVRCVAVAVPNVPTRLALSVSGPTTRMTESLVRRAVPLLHEAGNRISADLRGRDVNA
ncbi:MAG TPA: IclR family transcriptional regulator [Actinopolymorphaceae bacterium]|jgi:IclR family acetate operon transcriptional repressor